jgi:hypothetical protein
MKKIWKFVRIIENVVIRFDFFDFTVIEQKKLSQNKKKFSAVTLEK